MPWFLDYNLLEEVGAIKRYLLLLFFLDTYVYETEVSVGVLRTDLFILFSTLSLSYNIPLSLDLIC
jgi:hypothetical protein